MISKMLNSLKSLEAQTKIMFVFFVLTCAFSVKLQMNCVEKNAFKAAFARWAPLKAESLTYFPSPFEFRVLEATPQLWNAFAFADQDFKTEKVPQLYFALRSQSGLVHGVAPEMSLDLLNYFDGWAALQWSQRADLLHEALFIDSKSLTKAGQSEAFELALRRGFGASEDSCGLILKEKAFRWIMSDRLKSSEGLKYLKDCVLRQSRQAVEWAVADDLYIRSLESYLKQGSSRGLHPMEFKKLSDYLKAKFL